jgi:hypothetical protein
MLVSVSVGCPPGFELTYGAMLSALQALLGMQVTVMIEYTEGDGRRPVALLTGDLSRGVARELAGDRGSRLGLPAGEAVAFTVANAVFVMCEGDYKSGRRHEQALSFESAGVRFTIGVDADRA